jgi:pimeloyl-ACP methyl ester carboxylesterase
MIHAIPGMGADRRMYPVAWLSLPEFSAHDWMPYADELSLADVARSMCEARSIEDGDIIVGSSLGGMVACEVTKIRSIPVLYLIGSAVRKEEVNGLLALLHPLAKIAPIEWLRCLAGKIPMDVAQMFADIEPPFIRVMCSAIFQWDGLGATSTKVFRIHGKHDIVIPAPIQADLLLDGGHLISMTHAEECVTFIRTNQRLG